MGLKIIGAGFGRTGTQSLYTALNELGFPCYHMVEVLDNRANKNHLDFWHKIACDQPGAEQNWQQVFANYTAAVDNPACCVWRELVKAYPNAKVVLTVHPKGPDAWYESTLKTIYFSETLWQFKLLERVFPPIKKLAQMLRKLIWQRAHKNTMGDRQKAIARYHAHIDEVTAGVPAEQLLIYSVNQGWQPLCEFLGVPVPATQFPSVNDREDFQKRIRTIRFAAYGAIALGVLALFALGYTLALL